LFDASKDNGLVNKAEHARWKEVMCCDWRLDATFMEPLCLLGAQGPKEENSRTQRGETYL